MLPGRAAARPLLALAAAWVALASAPVAAQRDYLPRSGEWNGLSGLADQGRESGLEVLTPPVLDLGDVRATDGLLLVHPTQAPPVDSLAAFVNAGGRLAVADDFGASEPLLARFAIRRTPLGTTDAPRVRGHEGLVVARTHFRHPLTEGVDVLVTNHPAVVRHDHLEPLVAFDRNDGGVLLTGVVGNGRLVVLSDPSVLINHMRVFEGNARFASNLLGVLSGPAHGRVFVITEHTRIQGSFGADSTEPLATRFDRLLRRLATLDLPREALRVANVTLAALVLLLASTTWKTRSAYRFPWRTPHDERSSRSAESEARARAAIALHGELVRRLASFDGSADTLPAAARAALSARGFTAADIDRTDRLLAALAAIDAQWHAGASPRLSERELERLVATAEPLLGRLVIGLPPA